MEEILAALIARQYGDFVAAQFEDCYDDYSFDEQNDNALRYIVSVTGTFVDKYDEEINEDTMADVIEFHNELVEYLESE